MSAKGKLVEPKGLNSDAFDHTFGPCRFLLRLLGAWPDPFHISNWTTPRIVFITVTMFGFTIIPQTVKLAHSLKDLNLITEIIVNCDVPITIAAVKLLNMCYHRKEEYCDQWLLIFDKLSLVSGVRKRERVQPRIHKYVREEVGFRLQTAMEGSKVVLALALLAAVSPSLGETTSPPGELPKPSYARTMLKVSRSLPGETEELKIRTAEGSLATLIVKRREKSVVESPSAQGSNDTDAPATTIGYQNVDVDPWNRSPEHDQRRQKIEAARNWVPLSRTADSWRPLGEPLSGRSWPEATRAVQRVPADANSSEQLLRYALLPHEPRRMVRTNVGANLSKNREGKGTPAEVVVRSEINVKPQPGSTGQQGKRAPVALDADGMPVVYGRRVPDEPIDKVQVWRNARVINDRLVTEPAKGLEESGGSFDTFFEDVNRRYGKLADDSGSQKPKPYRNEVLGAEVYESAEDTYRPSIRKRMLQPEILSAAYPNSRFYSPPDTTKPSVAAVKPGTRAPVLQYAHPELGVQPAKAVAKSEPPNNKASRKHEETMTYTEAPLLQQYVPPSGSSNGEQRHQKRRYVLNEKNIIDSYNYKNYYPYTPHYYGLKRPAVEPPLWVKISEGIKNQFTDGVAKMSELTKPVLDPLAEATRKISENLGLSRSQDPAQDKVGSVATGSSILIPALGLMASGAALGIGAVAVGRYLDVDVLKRSNAGGEHFDADDERALEAVAGTRGELQGQPSVNQIYLLVEGDGYDGGASRKKRSSDDTGSRNIQRKGADPIAEIVEIDSPSRSLDDTISDEGNNVQLDNEEDFAEAIVQKAFEAITSRTKKDKSERLTEDTRMARKKRSLSDDELDDALQNLDKVEVAEGSSHIPGDWSNTPCAKKIFCDAMVKRGSDAHMVMDKKMYGLLRMIQPAAAVQVSAHFDEVMEAVRRHDCAVFSCPQAKTPRSETFSAPSA
ncbi:uncharacterized protein LOC106642046 [Copidosoma floridanum]|uniref:uncharacterized protein LOC106642046 n=1 Tax=Copidosoma floridanum TaxID=29053 RepID=UPI000C6F7142|nr:uncharacterized protein LOC106642046 [Copidosoma floridanum]